jgi:hypothetical protein
MAHSDRQAGMKCFVIRKVENLAVCTAYLTEHWAKANPPLRVEIEPEGKTRSKASNSRYFAGVITPISEQVWLEGRQYSKEAWHETAARKFLGVVDLPHGERMAISTANLSQKAFDEYVYQVEEWAQRELGVSFVEPEPGTFM